MIVHVKLFALARQQAGRDRLPVEVHERATVADLRVALAAQYPDLAGLLPHVMFAVNADYADSEAVLSEQDEIACIPPVSGG
jgi:molybdopterin converting factor subunit 1